MVDVVLVCIDIELDIRSKLIRVISDQVLCYVIPSLVKLRKEGLDANEKIKSYMYVYSPSISREMSIL